MPPAVSVSRPPRYVPYASASPLGRSFTTNASGQGTSGGGPHGRPRSAGRGGAAGRRGGVGRPVSPDPCRRAGPVDRDPAARVALRPAEVRPVHELAPVSAQLR